MHYRHSGPWVKHECYWWMINLPLSRVSIMASCLLVLQSLAVVLNPLNLKQVQPCWKSSTISSDRGSFICVILNIKLTKPQGKTNIQLIQSTYPWGTIYSGIGLCHPMVYQGTHVGLQRLRNCTPVTNVVLGWCLRLYRQNVATCTRHMNFSN